MNDRLDKLRWLQAGCAAADALARIREARRRLEPNRPPMRRRGEAIH